MDAESIVSFKSFLEFVENNSLYYIQQQILENGKTTALLILGVFLITTSALSNCISYFAYYVRIPIRTGISRDLRNEAYATILHMPINAFSNENKGDFISRMTNDIEEVDYGIGTAMDMIIKEPIKVIVYICTLISISILLTFEALLLLCLSCVVIALVGKAMKHLARKGQQYRATILSTFEQTLGKLKFIKAFNLDKHFYTEFEGVSDETMEVLNKTNRRYSIAWPLTDFLLSVSIAVLMCLGGSFILNETSTLSAEKFIYFLVVFFSIVPPIRNITKSTYGIRKAMASVERMNYILSLNKEKDSLGSKIDNVCQQNVGIEFRNISFGYTKKDIVLNNVNLHIPLNQITIIKGETGTGKTSLFNLLLKLYAPLEGQILYNGVDINKLSTYNLRNTITYVSQDPVLFNDSIYNNVNLGKLDASTSEIVLATKLTGIDDFISSLPDKYSTIIGDQGMNLSNGQRQAIAIARALLRNTPILILDEATNCMDSLLELKIMENIKQLYNGRTIIIISHNDNLNDLADNIISIKV
jgi:ABC-type multidrug transport system fused ATPase/permease subunit